MIISFKLRQSLPHWRLLRLMPRGPMLGSDISHSSIEVERGTSAHSQLQLWAMAISSEQRLHLGMLFNSRKQWHGLTAAPQKVLCCKSPEADCFVSLLYCPKCFAVCSSQKLFTVFSCLTCKQRNRTKSILCAELFREMMHVTLMQPKTLSINP